MLRPNLARTLAPVAIISLAAIAMPQYSGLAGAPSVKTQKHNELKIQFRQTSLDSELDSRYVKNLQLLYGLTKNIELAFDNDLDGNSRFGAKYSFLIDEEQKIRFGIGAQDIFDDPELYLGFAKDFTNFELHAGFIDKSKGQAFIGYRQKFSDDLRLTADHITGPSGRTSGRIDYFFDKNWSLDVRVYFPNNDSAPRTHRFGIAYQTMLNQK